MDIEVIHRYRTAAFLQRMTRMLAASRPPTPTYRSLDWSEFTVDLIQWAVGADAPFPSSYSAVEDISEMAVQYLLIASEVQLLQWGEHTGYYPDGASRQVFELINDTAGPALTDFMNLTIMIPEALPSDHPLLRHEEYPHLQAVWRDAITPALTRCVELVMFSAEERWEHSMREVAALSRRLHLNPSLSMPADEIDRVAWALTGADDLYAPDEESPITWSMVWQGFHASVHTSRTDRLGEVRETFLPLLDVLTDDGSPSTARWLLRQLSPQALAPFDYDWPAEP